MLFSFTFFVVLANIIIIITCYIVTISALVIILSLEVTNAVNVFACSQVMCCPKKIILGHSITGQIRIVIV